MRFKSKIDWWLKAILMFMVFLCVYLIVMAVSTKSIEFIYSAIILLTVFIGIFISIYIFTFYEITDDLLIIKSGLYKKSIKIANIKGISPTHNPISSAALSVNRIAIYYVGKKTVKMSTEFVSPGNKQAFIDNLKAINENIVDMTKNPQQ